jgi:preprotein translocase subunit SecF
MKIFTNPNFDFVGYRWHAIALSVAIIAAGLVAVALKGFPLGVEFSSGTIVIVQFEPQVPSIDQIRAAAAPVAAGGGQDLVVQRYGQESARQVMIRVPEVGPEQVTAPDPQAGAGTETGLGAVAARVVKALTDAKLGSFTVEGTEIVGPMVGRDLTRKGIWATVLSLAGVLAYIAIRFRFSFAVGAVVATVHDLLVMMTFLVVFGYDLTLNVIAAVLTIAGYSVNDTVVVFDRVRENLKGMRKDDISTVINVAVNQTLGRTVITAGTTLLSVVALYLFGGEVLRGFAFTMIVGVISGTYSTVFIAAAVVSFRRGRSPARVPAAAGGPGARGGAGPPPPRPTPRAGAPHAGDCGHHRCRGRGGEHGRQPAGRPDDHVRQQLFLHPVGRKTDALRTIVGHRRGGFQRLHLAGRHLHFGQHHALVPRPACTAGNGRAGQRRPTGLCCPGAPAG